MYSSETQSHVENANQPDSPRTSAETETHLQIPFSIDEYVELCIQESSIVLNNDPGQREQDLERLRDFFY